MGWRDRAGARVLVTTMAGSFLGVLGVSSPAAATSPGDGHSQGLAAERAAPLVGPTSLGPAERAADPERVAEEGEPRTTNDTYDVGDAPLDPETLALIEALTSSPAESAPPVRPPVWPSGGPFARPISGSRLRETLARDVSGAFERLPTLQGSLRGRLGPIREIDDLRLEPGLVDVGRLDPWLFGGAVVRRSPSAATATRLWTSDVALIGLPAPTRPGWSGDVAMEARSADRGVGAYGTIGAGTEGAALRVSGRFDETGDLRVRTGSVAFDRRTAARRFGLSVRGRLLGEPRDAARLDLGYDYDGEIFDAPASEGEDLHLAQATLSAAGGSFSGRVTGGWIGARSRIEALDLLQARVAIVFGPPGRPAPRPAHGPFGRPGEGGWGSLEPRDPAHDSMLEGDRGGTLDLDLASEETGAGGMLRRSQPQPVPTVEVGGLYTSAVRGAALERGELYARTSSRLGPLAMELTGRLSDQRSEERNPGLDLALDARVLLEVTDPLSLFARYGRSYGLLDAGGREVEATDLIEGGTFLLGAAGWWMAAVWAGRAQGPLTEPDRPAVNLWGLASEGALVVDRFVLAGALSRAMATLEAGGRVTPTPTSTARLSIRAEIEEWRAFAEMGARALLETSGQREASLLGPALEDAPYVLLDFRAAVALGAGFLLRVTVDNMLDRAWSFEGARGPMPGLDLRAALVWGLGG